MKKIIRLTESELINVVKKIISEKKIIKETISIKTELKSPEPDVVYMKPQNVGKYDKEQEKILGGGGPVIFEYTKDGKFNKSIYSIHVDAPGYKGPIQVNAIYKTSDGDYKVSTSQGQTREMGIDDLRKLSTEVISGSKVIVINVLGGIASITFKKIS